MFAFLRTATLSPVAFSAAGAMALRYTGAAAGLVAASTATYLVGRTTLRFAERGTARLAAYLSDSVNDLDERLQQPSADAPASSKKKKSDIDPVELEIARRVKAGILKQVAPSEPETAAAE